MYNIPLAGSTVATGPIVQPAPAADLIAQLNGVANDINQNIGGRVMTLAGVTNSVSSTSALVVASLNTGVPLGNLLSPRGTGNNGQGIRCIAWGTYAQTTGAKLVSLVFGATSLALNLTSSTTAAGAGWYGQMEIRKSASSSQQIFGFGSTSGGSPANTIFASASNSETAAATFAIVGTASSGLANEIVVNGMEIQWLP